jgi:hypothetical protein
MTNKGIQFPTKKTVHAVEGDESESLNFRNDVFDTQFMVGGGFPKIEHDSRSTSAEIR